MHLEFWEMLKVVQVNLTFDLWFDLHFDTVSKKNPPEMHSPPWKTLIKRYYTTRYVIEIKGWKFAEIQDGRDRHLELWEMLKVPQGATKLILLS